VFQSPSEKEIIKAKFQHQKILISVQNQLNIKYGHNSSISW